ncbi:MAG: beta-galactosidase [Clostridia bacterium]|nr:beta-galactosidase [Clostridia bacterium]
MGIHNDYSERNYVNPAFPHFVHGADYNPEQWIVTKEIWGEDMKLMREAGCNEMTVGIFSWAELEPEEGRFDFSFLDEIIDMIDKNGGKVILATPSGARPRWLASKYPEVLRVRPDGTRIRFGGRHNHCYTSPAYREKVRIINTELARRYSHNPAVMAWHVSNEYGGECFCPLCQEAFRGFLREKYHNNIDELNHAYWARFWSHTYRDFSEIEAPSEYTDTSIHGLTLDWKRFVTHQTVDFMKNEILPLKAENPDLPVTTNMQYDFRDLDYFQFRDVLDFASWDAYPRWHSGDDALTASAAAFWHDFYRCLKNKPFFLMESTPSLVNWQEYNKPKKPGLDTLSSVQAVAHGSDSVQYFQWRKGRGSSEKLHGAVVGHDGSSDTRVFRSVRRTGDILEQTDEITGSGVKAECAIILDWENRWALEDCQGFVRNDKKYIETCYQYHHVMWSRAVNCDVVHPHDDFGRYKLVIAPMLYMTDSGTIENLSRYVRNGGTLIATYHTGTVDGTDLCWLGKTPAGTLSDVFGIWREETDTLYPWETGKIIYLGKEYAVKDVAEVIHASSAETVGEYRADYYYGFPAVTRNSYGKGTAYYQAFRDDGCFIRDWLPEIMKEAGVAGNIPNETEFPHGFTAHSRQSGGDLYLFCENYSDSPVRDVHLGQQYIDMLTGEKRDTVSLEPYGLAVLKTDLASRS